LTGCASAGFPTPVPRLGPSHRAELRGSAGVVARTTPLSLPRGASSGRSIAAPPLLGAEMLTRGLLIAGEDLRLRVDRGGDDRPARSSRRDPLVQGRQLPASRQGPRLAASRRVRGLTFRPAKPSGVGAFQPGLDTDAPRCPRGGRGDAQVRAYTAPRCKTPKQARSGTERKRLESLVLATPERRTACSCGKMR
jgi:hypothetical protein